MKINIEQIPDLGFDTEFDEKILRFPVLEKLSENGDCDFLTPLKVRLHLKLMRKLMVEARGSIRARIRLGCSRCLSPFETDLNSDFQLVYAVPSPGSPRFKEKNELELSTEDVGLMYYDGILIDTDDLVQEQTVMALPYRALCNESCKGLCTRCGSDLNRGTCSCDNGTIDPRFAMLKKLKLNDQTK